MREVISFGNALDDDADPHLVVSSWHRSPIESALNSILLFDESV